jgi:hypothetical protein
MKTSFLRHFVISMAILVVMVLFSACSGLGNGQSTLTGSIVSVNASTGTVVVSVGNQQQTIKNVPANVIQLLQNQVGKTYSVQVTTNSDGSFSIVSGSTPILSNSEGTPTTDGSPSTNDTPTTGTTTTTTNEPGSMTFYGSVQSTGSNSLVVTMPTGGTLPFTTNSATDLKDWPNNGLPSTGTQVKVEVTANTTDGSFTATKVGNVTTGDDTTQAQYTGVTTAAVGSDHMLHFTVGNKSFSLAIASNADLSAFTNGSIPSGATVSVTVQFTGTTGSVTKVDTSNGN